MVLIVRSEYIRVTDSDYDVDLMGFIDGWLDGVQKWYCLSSEVYYSVVKIC